MVLVFFNLVAHSIKAQMEQCKLLTGELYGAHIAVNMFFHFRLTKGLVLHNNVTVIG